MHPVSAHSTRLRQASQVNQVQGAVLERQAVARQKRGKSDQDHPEGSAGAHAHPNSKRVRFTEPAQHDSIVYDSASNAPETQHSRQHPAVRTIRSRAASTHSRLHTTTSVPSAEEECQYAPAQDPAGEGLHTAHKTSIAARTRAASTSRRTLTTRQQQTTQQSTSAFPNQIEEHAARTRSAPTVVAVTTGRSKRKEPASIGPDEEERCPAAKRVRAGRASSGAPAKDSIAPRPGTATSRSKSPVRPAKANSKQQQPARPVSGASRGRSARLRKMH